MKKNNKGFGLTELMVAVGLVSIIMAGVLAIFDSSSKSQKRANSMFGIEQIRRNLSTMLANTSVWNQTVAKNTSLSCLQSPSTIPCNHGDKLNFSIYSAGGAIYFNSATQGFKFDGTICNLTDSDCALTLAFETQIECASGNGTCASPSSIIAQGKFANVKLPGNEKFAFNPANYLITVREDISALAAGAGGMVIQLKCAAFFSAGVSEVCGNTTLPAYPNYCTPNSCPAGFNDAGVSSETTSSGFSAYGSGNCVRTCYK